MSSWDGLLGTANGIDAVKLESLHREQNKVNVIGSHVRLKPRRFAIVLLKFVFVL